MATYSMNLPLTHTIGIKRYRIGVEDELGNITDGWDAAVDYDVYAIAPASTEEPFESGRNAVINALSVFAPPDLPIGSQDRVVIDGDEYTVEGLPADWTKGPWAFSPGLQFLVRKVTG